LECEIKTQYIKPISGKKIVRDLFKNVSNQILIDLDIIELFDKNIETLSGGEMQRVSIGLTAIKSADVYILMNQLHF
jgi:ATP-binding cassette subfamily E protein 1